MQLIKKIVLSVFCVGFGAAAMMAFASYMDLHKGEAATPVAKADAPKQDAVQPTPMESPGVPEKVEERKEDKGIPYIPTPEEVRVIPHDQPLDKDAQRNLEQVFARQNELLAKAQKRSDELKEKLIAQMKALSAAQMQNKMLKEALAKK